MGVGEDFQTFCNTISRMNREAISQRYQLLTKRLNLEFWETDSYSAHSLYIGSYGRGTATGRTSDIDMLFRLPGWVYAQYDAWVTNGQSGLLQAVRTAIKKTYSDTAVGADGQVVVVSFSDGTRFEVLPAFANDDGESFTFPNANAGGAWRTTNPKPEIDAVDLRDRLCNFNLKYLCRMARAWRETWNVPISGLLIDTLAYQFIETWEERDKSFLYYDWMSRDFFQFLGGQSETKKYWLSPGAGQYVWRDGVFERKASACYKLALKAIEYDTNQQNWSARNTWREIYGSDYPA